MKNGRSAAGVLIVMLLAYGASASAQSKQQNETRSKAQAKTGDHSAEEMKREMQNARPGPEHTRLAKLAGDYTTATKFFAAPGAAPMESSGEARLSLTLDGRFLIEKTRARLQDNRQRRSRCWATTTRANVTKESGRTRCRPQ